LFAIEQAADLVSFAVDRQFMPGAGGDGGLRTDDVAALSVDNFIKSKGVPQRAGPNHIVIGFILNAKRNTGHLLLLSTDGFEPCGQGEVIECFVVENQKWKMFIGGVLRCLGQDRFFGDRRGIGREWFQDGRNSVEDDFPVTWTADAGDRAAKPGGELIFMSLAKIKTPLRGENGRRAKQ